MDLDRLKHHRRIGGLAICEGRSLDFDRYPFFRWWRGTAGGYIRGAGVGVWRRGAGAKGDYPWWLYTYTGIERGGELEQCEVGVAFIYSLYWVSHRSDLAYAESGTA